MSVQEQVTQRVKSSLDSAGVLGFFGGDAATAALFRRAVYENGSFSGWYNTAGSYDIARRLSRLSKSRFSDTVFRGPNVEPATVFEHEVPEGPGYRAAHSGTWIPRTGHVARILEEECAELPAEVVDGRKTTPIGVTIVDLTDVPKAVTHPKLHRKGAALLAFVPIAASVSATIMCFLAEDWFAASTILLGILTSGVSSIALGSGCLTFDHPIAATGSPDGDGILITNREVIIVKGKEDAVNAITRGRFLLQFKSEFGYRLLKASSLLYTLQFLLQLLLVPQATLQGQIMYIASIVISWAYGAYIMSLDNGKIQRKVLMESVLNKPNMRKYALGTRTAMAVFVLLVMKPSNLERHLDELLPNDTAVWKIWKATIIERIRTDHDLRFPLLEAANREDITDDEFDLLNTLFCDAEAAQHAYELESSRSGSGLVNVVLGNKQQID